MTLTSPTSSWHQTSVKINETGSGIFFRHVGRVTPVKNAHVRFSPCVPETIVCMYGNNRYGMSLLNGAVWGLCLTEAHGENPIYNGFHYKTRK